MSHLVVGYGFSTLAESPNNDIEARPVGELMYTPLETVFYDTMIREGKTVTAYTSGAEFQAFMRRNDDGNNFEDRITLFYATDAPVVQGSLVSYGRKTYILVNRETEENDCYYKSSGLACNGMITLNDGSVTGVPCYAYNMNGSLADENSFISVIDGNIEFITEANSLSRQVKINNTFNEFGRTFKVENTYYKDGILHIIAKVDADQKPEEHPNIIIDGLERATYDVGDQVQLTATLYLNNTITTGTVTWISSDKNVATINGNGLVNFIGNGAVAFTAYWVEKDMKITTNTVGVGQKEAYSVFINGSSTIRVGFKRSYTAILKDNTGIEQEGTWEWDYEFEYPNDVTFTPNGNKVSILIENEDHIDLTLKLIAREKENNIETSLDITVVPGF